VTRGVSPRVSAADERRLLRRAAAAEEAKSARAAERVERRAAVVAAKRAAGAVPGARKRKTPFLFLAAVGVRGGGPCVTEVPVRARAYVRACRRRHACSGIGRARGGTPGCGRCCGCYGAARDYGCPGPSARSGDARRGRGGGRTPACVPRTQAHEAVRLKPPCCFHPVYIFIAQMQARGRGPRTRPLRPIHAQLPY
jgi:hypothetical protein